MNLDIGVFFLNSMVNLLKLKQDCNQARIAMFALRVKIGKMSLPIYIEIHLLKSMICSSEV